MEQYGPALRFLGVFVGLYLLLNTFYGLWIQSYYPLVDPITLWVAEQTTFLLSYFGQEFTALPESNSPNVALWMKDELIVLVYEGCNGINVVIVYLVFLVAYKGEFLRLLKFVLGGIGLIHLLNLIRVGLLAEVALFYPDYLYFFHKFFFTGFIYAVVFALWFLWVKRRN